MINHARTLLLNVRSADAAVSDVAPYISPLFKPVAIPSEWESVRKILFGSNPDYDMLSYRASQLLPFIHTPTFLPYVTALDSRITYRMPPTDVQIFPMVDVTPVSTDDGAILTVLDTQTPPDDSGRMRWVFSVTVPGGNTIEVADLKTQSVQTIAASLTDSLSPAYPLGNSGHTFKINTLAATQRWLVTTKRPPVRDPGVLLSLVNRNQGAIIDALGDLAEQEPYRSFVNYWTKQTDMPEMFGAVLMLLIYVTEHYRAKT